MEPVSDRPQVAPFTPGSAKAALLVACEGAGIEAGDAELVRLGENALFHLRRSSLVVRVARGMEHWEDATKEVAVSAWLAELGIPAARTATGIGQPVVADGRPVTFWAFLDGRNAGRADVRALGQVLRRVHAAKAPTGFALPRQNPLERVSERIASAPIPLADKDFREQDDDMDHAERPSQR
ncbi:phosphotransferase [Actinosynnema sp. NPDC020468]|uniref:phosphotransferase n=1 Tax=Actinosynnema sp. NPDC020468 TaxID=3154488 RepID=UPI0033D10A59